MTLKLQYKAYFTAILLGLFLLSPLLQAQTSPMFIHPKGLQKKRSVGKKQTALQKRARLQAQKKFKGVALLAQKLYKDKEGWTYFKVKMRQKSKIVHKIVKIKA